MLTVHKPRCHLNGNCWILRLPNTGRTNVRRHDIGATSAAAAFNFPPANPPPSSMVRGADGPINLAGLAIDETVIWLTLSLHPH